MTELLDPKFAQLPTPLPKKSGVDPFKRMVRLSALKMIGQFYRRKARSDRRLKLLLIRPDHMGDLLFLTPGLRYLRALLPDAEISLLVGSWGKTLMKDNRDIDNLLICEFPGFTRQPKRSLWQPYRYLFNQAKLLKQRQFDMAVILRFDHWWGAWLAAAAGIPRRVGYNIPEVKPFLTDILPYQDQRHEVEQNWRLIHYAWSMGALEIIDAWSDAEVMGGTAYTISAEDKAWADDWLAQHGVSDEETLVVIHPGAGAAVKLWRSEAWAELAQILVDRHHSRVVLTGSPVELSLCQTIAQQVTPAPLIAAGKTTVGQLAALMAQATMVIGPDTGPVKLATATGTPTIELYGPVDAKKFGPWGDPTQHRYITSGLGCIACNHLDYPPAELADHFCISGLSVPWVLREVTDLLSQCKDPVKRE